MRGSPPLDEQETKRRRRRALDTARWRSRRDRGVQLSTIEIKPLDIELAKKVAGLKPELVDDPDARSDAITRLYSMGVAALLNSKV